MPVSWEGGRKSGSGTGDTRDETEPLSMSQMATLSRGYAAKGAPNPSYWPSAENHGKLRFTSADDDLLGKRGGGKQAGECAAQGQLCGTPVHGSIRHFVATITRLCVRGTPILEASISKALSRQRGPRAIRSSSSESGICAMSRRSVGRGCSTMRSGNW